MDWHPISCPHFKVLSPPEGGTGSCILNTLNHCRDGRHSFGPTNIRKERGKKPLTHTKNPKKTKTNREIVLYVCLGFFFFFKI